MKKGVILKGIGGQYDVQTDEGVLLCTLRGRLRLSDERILVGDGVEISQTEAGGVVENILPRRNELARPAIANVDQVVVVFSATNPKPNFLLLDRILVQGELAELPAIIVFNKGDLDQSEAENLQTMYSQIPYHTIVTSVEEKQGLDELEQLLKDKISVLAGPSGVGKSSLLNALDPTLELEVGEISSKLRRGRHTTRSVELIPLKHGGYVADTPGFSQLGIGSDLEANLRFAFPEMKERMDECRFRGCLHRREPGCAIKDALDQGEILPHRYEHYLLLLEEVVPQY